MSLRVDCYKKKSNQHSHTYHISHPSHVRQTYIKTSNLIYLPTDLKVAVANQHFTNNIQEATFSYITYTYICTLFNMWRPFNTRIHTCTSQSHIHTLITSSRHPLLMTRRGIKRPFKTHATTAEGLNEIAERNRICDMNVDA